MDGHHLASAALGAPEFVTARDGTRLFLRVWGDGAPVVFIHSWSAASDMWRYQMAHLAERGARCIAYDRRGHGRSADPGRGFDFDTLADDLAAVIEALDLEGAVLVGHSMGAGEIVRYLSRHGDGRVAKIVLLAPTTPCLKKSPDNPNGVDAAAFEAVREIWRNDFAGWMADNAPPFFVPETSPATVRWMLAMTDACSLKAAIECNVAIVDADFRAELKAIKVPTLVIQGDKDASGPVEITGAPTAALVPGAKLIVYEGGPHGLFITHASRLNEELEAFIEG
jgi:pimeloyl-ACP methyl ester carboxylesterase